MPGEPHECVFYDLMFINLPPNLPPPARCCTQQSARSGNSILHTWRCLAAWHFARRHFHGSTHLNLAAIQHATSAPHLIQVNAQPVIGLN